LCTRRKKKIEQPMHSLGGLKNNSSSLCQLQYLSG
jgi:hypothetical protein